MGTDCETNRVPPVPTPRTIAMSPESIDIAYRTHSSRITQPFRHQPDIKL
jgi:hypothetical protein